MINSQTAKMQGALLPLTLLAGPSLGSAVCGMVS